MFTATNTTPYYTPSGRTPLVGIVIFLVGGIIAAWILGIAYTYAVEYIPIIYANILATFGFGFALGWVCDRLAKIGKLRSPAKVTILAIIVALIGLWLHWAFFCAFLAPKIFLYPVSYVGHLISPAEIIHTARHILEHGHFTLGRNSHAAVTGTFLAAIWIIETLLIVALCAIVSRSTSRKPYSETCDCWATEEKLPAHLPAITDPTAFKTEAETGNLATLLSATPVLETEPTYTELTLHAAENDPDCHHLTLEEVAITHDKKGKKQRKTKTLVEHLRITPAQHEKLRAQFGAATTNKH